MTRRTAALLALHVALASASGHTADVRDDLDRQVSLSQPAQRIVTLSPHATELVLAAGADRLLVGIASTGTLADRPGTLPRIGGPGALDREALLGLRPDLVIAWQSGNRASDLDWIASTGIALYRSEPESLKDIAASIRDIGSLSATRIEAENSASLFEQSIRTPCQRLPPQPVYLVIWERPAMTVGGRHWINAVLQAAGYRNVFDYVDRGVFHIAPEAAHTYLNLPRISLIRTYDNSQNDLLADILSRPGPRLAEAVELLCIQRLGQATAVGPAESSGVRGRPRE